MTLARYSLADVYVPSAILPVQVPGPGRIPVCAMRDLLAQSNVSSVCSTLAVQDEVLQSKFGAKCSTLLCQIRKKLVSF